MCERQETMAGQEEQSPWDRQTATLNQSLMGLPVLIGMFAIARYKPRKLLLYVPGIVVLMTYWRRFVCARCQYYGQECSTKLGIMTARMMPRDDSKPLDRNAMIADFTYMGALALMPLPQAFKKTSLGLFYLAALVAGYCAILFNACGRCGNEFCPMKDFSNRMNK